MQKSNSKSQNPIKFQSPNAESQIKRRNAGFEIWMLALFGIEFWFLEIAYGTM
jgi:hypothetical protein